MWSEMKLRSREMFYLTTHSTHFIYGYMASDIWLRTILIVRKETRCHHIGYSYRLTARVLLYAPSHRQDNTYHGLCYTNRGALAGTRNSSMGPPHEGSIRRPIAPWANALPLSYVPLPSVVERLLMVRWIVGSSHHGGSIELILVPASAPRRVDVTKAVVCYPVCGMLHTKDPLLLFERSSPCTDASRFPL